MSANDATSTVCVLLLASFSFAYAGTDVSDKTEETARTQTSEALNLAGGAKAAVAEYFLDHGQLPLNNDKAGLSEPFRIVGKYVVSVTVTDGTISVMFGENSIPEIYGHTIELIPKPTHDRVSWICLSYTLPDKFLPSTCRNRG